MNHQFQSIILKCLAGLIIIGVCTSTLFPYFTNNHTEIAFTGGPNQASTISLEELVVTSAGYYLDSYSNLLATMHAVELSQPGQFNQQELQLLLEKTIQTLKKANDTYISLKQVADISSYNATVLDYLLTFDFDGFAATNHCRVEAFSRVKKYLNIGNTRAIYNEMISDTAKILDMLMQFKADVDAGLFPNIPNLWKINQAYSDTLLFGQYVAQVFHHVLTDIYGKK